MTKQQLMTKENMAKITSDLFAAKLEKFTTLNGYHPLYYIRYKWRDQIMRENSTLLMPDDDNAKFAIDQAVKTVKSELIKNKVIRSKKAYYGHLNIILSRDGKSTLLQDKALVYLSCIGLY